MEILLGNHRAPGSGPVCVKRFQAAGVFGRGEREREEWMDGWRVGGREEERER